MVVRPAFLSFAFLLLANSSAIGQGFSVSPRMGFGGSKDRMVMAGTIEARIELPVRTVSPYLSLGWGLVGQGCEDSQPPNCDFPSSTAFEMGIGGFVDGSVSHGIPFYASFGTGARSWHGWDYHLTAEMGLRLRLSGRLGLDFGVRGSRLWVSERTCTDLRSCPVRSSEKELDAGMVVVGLRFMGGDQGDG